MSRQFSRSCRRLSVASLSIAAVLVSLFVCQASGTATLSPASLTLSPSNLSGGSPSTGTVTLSGPAPTGGLVVALASSDTAVAAVSVSLSVAAGKTTGTFSVTTKTVVGVQSLTITAVAGGVSRTANLIVNPVGVTPITVDVTKNQHAINPNVYGVAFAPTAQVLSDLNVPLNRSGGNSTSTYNWLLNADNKSNDWYFESIGYPSSVAGEQGDTFIAASKAGNAQAMLTIPTIGWVANLAAGRAKLDSFSQAKYGAQTAVDPYWSDAGNGILKSTNQNVTGNNPKDACVPSDAVFQGKWMDHLVQKWGKASAGGLKYYLMDNEPSIWQATHRDVHPVGQKMAEERDAILTYGAAVKSRDASALVAGPEEWGWTGYFYSGYDQQWGATHNWQAPFPDQTAAGGMYYLPWLLDQIHKSDVAAGKRTLDVFTVHCYPQSGEFGSDVSTAMQLLRNKSTRCLWDPNYVDQSWIGTSGPASEQGKVQLIPRIKGWVAQYYPGTLTGITEYNWGAESHINGATAQADILGIFGREGLDLACRWTTPAAGLPTYNAIKMYRNYDGARSTFGDTSVIATVPNPDNLAAFGATRTKDGALTVMVVNKVLSGPTPVSVQVAGFAHPGAAQVWQLTAANQISRQPDVSFTGTVLSTTVPAQSITLFVLASAPQPFTDLTTASPASVYAGAAVSIQSKITNNGSAVAGAVVTLTVVNKASAIVSSKAWTAQAFSGRQTQTCNWSMTAPAATGAYVVRVKVTGATGTPVYCSNDTAAAFTVNPAPTVPAFTATAIPSPASVAGGAPVTIAAQITDTGAAMTGGVVDLEVYDSGGNKVGQQFWQTESFTAGQAKTYPWNWTAPATTGAYTIKIGVFGPNWTPDYLWVDNAGTIQVSGAAAPSFATSATANPASVAGGASTAITTTVTDKGGPMTGGVVMVQVYDPSWNVVGQQQWQSETFAAGQARTYTWNWTAPATPGTYVIMTGTYGPNWTPQYTWNGNAGTITVH